jgi:transposase
MPSALSVDLREGVVAAIEAGASRRQAGKRFGVAAASAIRWHERFREEGRIAPRRRGGDQRSRAIEAQAERVVALYEARSESFLWELRDALAEDGVTTSTSGLSRFFRRHAITRQKRPRTRPSRSGRM